MRPSQFKGTSFKKMIISDLLARLCALPNIKRCFPIVSPMMFQTAAMADIEMIGVLPWAKRKRRTLRGIVSVRNERSDV
jgi:hypothetical protein